MVFGEKKRICGAFSAGSGTTGRRGNRPTGRLPAEAGRKKGQIIERSPRKRSQRKSRVVTQVPRGGMMATSKLGRILEEWRLKKGGESKLRLTIGEKGPATITKRPTEGQGAPNHEGKEGIPCLNRVQPSLEKKCFGRNRETPPLKGKGGGG